MELKTVYPFCLPKGYVDAEGTLHREGRMRLATAGDELSALRDLRVKEDETMLNTVLLSRVVVSLGTLPAITPDIIQGLFICDMEYLQNMYDTINRSDKPQLPVTCPYCGKEFTKAMDFHEIV